MKYITKEQYGLLVPSNFDYGVCANKGYLTDNELNDEYYRLESSED